MRPTAGFKCTVAVLLLLLLRVPAMPAPWATIEACAAAQGHACNATHDDLHTITATIPIPPSGVLFFVALGPYNFAPTSATVVGGGLQQQAGIQNISIAVTEQLLDLFYPIKVLRWDVGSAPAADPPRQLRVEKSWTDKNVHLFWQKIIVLNDTSVLARTSALRRRQAGVPLAGLPASVRHKTFADGYAKWQNASLVDPVLSRLDPGHELTDRDPIIEAAAFPKTAMKIAFASRHSIPSPMFAYNTGLWFTMNNVAARCERGCTKTHMDTWAS